MDSLIPWERAKVQRELFLAKDRLDAYATPKQREENAAFLGRDFHVVVGNPPYIVPKDARKRDDYRIFWPDSCHMRYGLAAPFAERILTAPVGGGFSGQITANSFARRQFGAPLIEDVIAQLDLTEIVDTSGAHIPGHGTPTLMLFARHAKPKLPTVRCISGKRGEPKRPDFPEQGLVWTAIATAENAPSDSNVFVSVANVDRRELAHHPWSLGGGAATEIRDQLQPSKGFQQLREVVDRVGMMTILKQDEVYFAPPPGLGRSSSSTVGLVEGVFVRDHAIAPPGRALFPYDPQFPDRALVLDSASPMFHHFWNFRGILRARTSTGFKNVEQRGLRFYEYPFYFPQTYASSAITFAEVATHNHFALSRGGLLFKQPSPAIMLHIGTTDADHLDLLGVLNSSTLEFWAKQVFHSKGNRGEGGGITAEDWEKFIQRNSTRMEDAPITPRDRDSRVALGRALSDLADVRALDLPGALLAAGRWSPASLSADLTRARLEHFDRTSQMVALQEELDWLTYSSHGLIDPVSTIAPESVEPLAPGHRPFEIVHARKDDEADDDEKSAWWSRHGHDRVTDIPDNYSEAHRARLQERIDLIESDARLALLETPPYKRRWQLPDWAAETKKAAEGWLLDRLEDLFAPATDATPRGPLSEPKPYRLEGVAVAWSRDPRVAAVAGVWTGTGASVDLTLVAEKLLRSNALPDNPHRLYSDEGLRKLGEWKRVWALQDQEDAHDRATADAKARGDAPPKRRLVDPDDASVEVDAISLPPKLDKGDFLKADSFSIRGKLNVPRERFIHFAELTPNRSGWNGWRDRERALAQVEAYTLAESDAEKPLPVPTTEDPRRCGVTFGLWESLPDVRRWGAADEHAELQALAREACRQPRCPCCLARPGPERDPGEARRGQVAQEACSSGGERVARATRLGRWVVSSRQGARRQRGVGAAPRAP